MNNADGRNGAEKPEKALRPGTSGCVSGLLGEGPPNSTSPALTAAAAANAVRKIVDLRAVLSQSKPARIMTRPPCLACEYGPAKWD
jgi:hypothetical protein